MVIFLDIDGVLVPARGWIRPELLSDGFAAFSREAVGVLRQFIADDTTVMLTTSHKASFTPKEWKAIFRRRGLQVSKIGTLETRPGRPSRKEELLSWFSGHKLYEPFVILDDDRSLNDLPPHLKEKLVLTSGLTGLTKQHIPEIASRIA